MGFYKKPNPKDAYVEGSKYTAYTCSICNKKWNNERAKLQCESWDNRPTAEQFCGPEHVLKLLQALLVQRLGRLPLTEETTGSIPVQGTMVSL